MKQRSNFTEMLVTFCVCTTCITILEGAMGTVFFPKEQLDYGAFFAPPIFGGISVLLGFVTWSKKELSVKQTLFRKVIHLLLIEGMVFGLNYISGNIFSAEVNVALMAGIASVYIAVHIILWTNDQKSANLFNEKLREYQAAKRGDINVI